MYIHFDPTDRALAQKAIELTEKKIDSARTHLAELALPQMEAQRLGGFVGRVKKDLHNTERDGFDWNTDLRDALRVCLSIYQEKLESLREAQIKLHGQERLPLDGLDGLTMSINGGPEFPAATLSKAATALEAKA